MSYGGGSFFSFGNPFFLVLMAWSLYWKGRSLWVSARKCSKYWFIALLLINTMGILEIAYIYYFSKKESCCAGKEGKCCENKSEQCCKEEEKKEIATETKA